MRKAILLLLILRVCLLHAIAQDISFRFSDGIHDNVLKTSMEKRVSYLLTEINRAHTENRELCLNNLFLTQRAAQSLQQLWKNFHFCCNLQQIEEKCLHDVNGYEIRGIAITLTPMGNNYKGDINRELAISFSPDQEITGVHMALASNVFNYIVNRGKDVTDTRRRLEILKFVEDYRSYYDEKNLEALRQVFSDDALIITGKVIMKRAMGDRQARLRSEIVYNKQNKEEYLSSLSRIFANNRFIKVKFDKIRVVRHPAKRNYYGVTLHQNWQSSNYSDDGYVFLLWEFNDDGTPPIIHVRTWQPEMIGNRQIDNDEVFTENDFFIP